MRGLKKFGIYGLWGERNYELILNDGKLIMVGENGCGKTTVLRILFYTLEKRWGQLVKENFKRIKIVMNDNEEREFSKEQLGKPEEYMIDADSELLTRIPLLYRYQMNNRNQMNKCDKLMPEDVLEMIENMNYPQGMFDDIIEELEKKILKVPSSIKNVSEWLNLQINHSILYMPTYRRIEKGSNYYNKKNVMSKGRKKINTHGITNLGIEVSHIGMGDVNQAIYDLIEEIREEYAKSASQLNINCFKGILIQEYEKVDEIPLDYMYPECIEMIFNSVSDKELLDKDKEQIKEKLMAVIDKKEEYNEYDKIVIYYYNMLIKRYERLKEIEDRLEHFFYACNQYMTGKEFLYDPSKFKYTIKVESRDGSKKDMSIEQLSSGEKQIVALFSYLFLFISEPCMVVIDEPELSLSVMWQEKILEDIVNSGMCGELIVATQSPFVYDNSLRKYAHSIEEFLVLE